MNGYLACACGQCLPCRIARRRLWAHRIILESYVSKASYFVTLTYGSDYVSSDGNLVKADYQNYLKRLRKAIAPAKIRYFVAGEYGSKEGRPHYHLAVFSDTILSPDVFSASWGFGFVTVKGIGFASASYIAGYVTKKYSGEKKCTKKVQEFSRMSLKPGIGASAMAVVASSIRGSSGLSLILDGDVPNVLRHGGKLFALGRYLMRRLRHEISPGWDSSMDKIQRHNAELQWMHEEDVRTKTPEEISNLKTIFRGREFRKKIWLDRQGNKVLNAEKLFEITNQRVKL